MFPCLIVLIFFISHLNAAPLPRKMVDMTYVMDENARQYPILRNFNMTVVINGTIGDGVWVQAEEYTSSTHSGTHMDAPSHFVKGGMDIEHIPLDQLVAPAAVIDITEKASQDPDSEVTTEDLIRWETITGSSLDGTIVLIKSGWGHKYYNLTAYTGTSDGDVNKLHYPGIAPEAAQWLVDNRNIKGIGVDGLSLDKGPSKDFPSHQILLAQGIFGLENVANMDEIPIYGAMLHVMPMKMAKVSGSPTRIFATFPEVIFNYPE